MDTGKINDNYTFYDGYEGETKIFLSFQDNQTVHIWKGYFDDILIPCRLTEMVGEDLQEIIIK